MKKIVIAVLAVVAFANARIMLENNNACKDDSGKPVNSCQISLSEFSFGQNFELSGVNMFFFGSEDLLVSKSAFPAAVGFPEDVTGEAPSLPIRFFIMSDNAAYNSAMSLVHTAYASKATITVIFMNPISDVFKNNTEYSKSSSKGHTCYVNYDNANKPNSINCPIMAITLSQN